MSQPVRHPAVIAARVFALALAVSWAAGAALARNAQKSAPATAVSAPAPGSIARVATDTDSAGQTYADLVDLALASPVVAVTRSDLAPRGS